MSRPPAFSTTLSGNILITELVGTLDEVNARKLFNNLKQQILTLNGAPWGNILLAEHWELSAAKIDSILLEIEIWVRQHHRTHLVFIVGEQHAQIKRFTLKQHLGNNLKKDTFKIYNSREEGMCWLNQHGFSLSSQRSNLLTLPLD
ncbi:MAG: hypothetical protein ACW7DW_08405 [Paraglaciecola chathamensis]